MSDSSGLNDYLAYGALNNPGLEAAFNRWKAALERVPQVTALPDPRFNYQYFIQEVETRVGPQKQSIGLAQTFPWFGKLSLRGDLAMQQANAARERYETAKLKLFFDIKDAYYEYYYLTRSTTVTKENVALVRHLESVAVSRYKAAAATHPDVIRAQVEIGKLEDRYRTLVDLRGPVVARLNAVLNRPLDANLPRPEPIMPDRQQLVDDQLFERFRDNNPELKALDYQIRRDRSAIELAKKDYYPDITLGLNYIDTGDRNGIGPSDDGKDPIVAMLSLNIPLWRDKYDAGVREARLNHIASQRERRDKANSLGSDLKMALYRYRDSRRKIDLYDNALLPKARESLKVTEADSGPPKAASPTS